MGRKFNRLSLEKIATTVKQGNYADGGGLYLQVSGFKTKSWIFRFTLNKFKREMGLGSLNTISLSKARLKARKCRKQLSDGIDPIESRREKISTKNYLSNKIINLNKNSYNNYFPIVKKDYIVLLNN